MTITVIVLSLLIAVAVHEAAHALALRRLGIPISHAGIGLPLGPVLSIRGPRWPFTFTLSPWLVGAYVRHDEEHDEKIDALPYGKKAWYLNAGIVANLILGSALLATTALLEMRPAKAALCYSIAGALWLTRKPVAAYLIPALAIPALIAVISGLTSSWAAGDTGLGFAGLGDLVPPGFTGAVAFAGIISIATGLMNMLPLYGLDNGKVIDLIIHRWAPRWVATGYQTVGLALIVVLLAAAVGSDLWALWTALS